MKEGVGATTAGGGAADISYAVDGVPLDDGYWTAMATFTVTITASTVL